MRLPPGPYPGRIDDRRGQLGPQILPEGTAGPWMRHDDITNAMFEKMMMRWLQQQEPEPPELLKDNKGEITRPAAARRVISDRWQQAWPGADRERALLNAFIISFAQQQPYRTGR